MMVGVAMIASEKGGHIVAATIIVCSNDNHGCKPSVLQWL